MQEESEDGNRTLIASDAPGSSSKRYSDSGSSTHAWVSGNGCWELMTREQGPHEPQLMDNGRDDVRTSWSTPALVRTNAWLPKSQCSMEDHEPRYPTPGNLPLAIANSFPAVTKIAFRTTQQELHKLRL
jgi:hypothetical protein